MAIVSHVTAPSNAVFVLNLPTNKGPPSCDGDPFIPKPTLTGWMRQRFGRDNTL